MIDYTSVAQIKEVLGLFRLSMQKKFGQNFLIGDRYRKMIFSELQTEAVRTAWEIGPGLGSLTALFPPEKNLTLFEIDYGFIRFLETEFPDRKIVPGDFVKTFSAFTETNGVPDLIYGNLPYCSAAAMIGCLIEKAVLPPRMVFMVQKEAARRMKALPGSKDYSSFSLLCALDYDVKTVFDVPADCFFPQPDVVSTVVVMTRHDRNRNLNRRLYLLLASEMFKSRRKTLKNNLASAKGRFPDGTLEEAFGGCGIKMSDRGEEISPTLLSRIVSLLPGGVVTDFGKKENENSLLSD